MDMRCFIIYTSVMMMAISLSLKTDDALVFQPAEIFVSSRSVKVGEMIRFKCSVFEESDSSDQMNMFLCRNGVGVMMRLLGRKGEYTFIIKNVSELDSGNYSCVYSLNRYNLEEVKSSGLNSIHVQVTDISSTTTTPAPPSTIRTKRRTSENVKTSRKTSVHAQVPGNASVFQTAEIFVSSRSVKVGEMIRFKCSVFEESDSSDQMNMFLCRNGVGVMMRLLGRKGEYTFIIKNVSELDSGNYSCVYSLNRYNLEEVKSSGLNSIHVQVTGMTEEKSDSQWWINLLRLFCSVGVLLFMCLIVVFDFYSTRPQRPVTLDSA
ncbi:uncharacterized protein LOC111193399 isoform X1 [Astyanax mexicanus]|uniref:uncharacterized protein LOC111193399 isoform X1 n=1 Tax=Astyanax mexicanus TaxID=7994 RepID=UPI0020CABE21|nr:uncharacterized protein LOC111193399 isoform X1 [Astyanax mexicanus]